MKYLVIDIGGTALKYCIMDESTKIYEKHSVAAPVLSAEEFENTIYNIYLRHKDEICGIAISMAGFINSETGYLAGGGPYSSLWNTSVCDLLSKKIKCPIAIENDGKCAALAEVWKGALTNVKDAAVIIIGTGIGGGIVKDRKIHKGHQLTAGEFSFIPVAPAKYGAPSLLSTRTSAMGLCVEVAAAKRADFTLLDNYSILHTYFEKEFLEENLNREVAEGLEGVCVNGLKVFEWLEEGDAVVEEVYNRFIERIAWLVNVVEMIYDPELIAIGGGISRQERLVKDVQRAVNAFGDNLQNPAPRVRVVPCKFLSDANLYGAMYNYMLHYNSDNIK